MNRIPLTKENIHTLINVVESHNLDRYKDVLFRLSNKLDTATDAELSFLDKLFQEVVLEIGIETVE